MSDPNLPDFVELLLGGPIPDWQRGVMETIARQPQLFVITGPEPYRTKVADYLAAHPEVERAAALDSDRVRAWDLASGRDHSAHVMMGKRDDRIIIVDDLDENDLSKCDAAREFFLHDEPALKLVEEKQIERNRAQDTVHFGHHQQAETLGNYLSRETNNRAGRRAQRARDRKAGR